MIGVDVCNDDGVESIEGNTGALQTPDRAARAVNKDRAMRAIKRHVSIFVNGIGNCGRRS